MGQSVGCSDLRSYDGEKNLPFCLNPFQKERTITYFFGGENVCLTLSISLIHFLYFGTKVHNFNDEEIFEHFFLQ